MERLRFVLVWLSLRVFKREVSWYTWSENRTDLASLNAAVSEPERDYEDFLVEMKDIYDD